MSSRCSLAALAMILLTAVNVLAQEGSAPSWDVTYWVDYWSRPSVNLFGSDQEEFNKNMQPIFFPWNEHEDPSNPNALDSDIQWLKEHPNVRFYVDGYASSRGDLVYNLALSQRRADWVKQALMSRGVPEDRIKLATGWGQVYPVCPELNDDCWSKNRLVRLRYSPD